MSQFHGAVAVLCEEGRFLVIRRSAHVVAPRKFCFPGGGLEPGETDRDAVVREIREELGLEVRPIQRLWQSVTPWGISLAWWHVERTPDANPEPNPAEVESHHWYTAAEIRALPDLLESMIFFLDALDRDEIRLAQVSD